MRGSDRHLLVMQGFSRSVLFAGVPEHTIDVGNEMMDGLLALDGVAAWVAYPANSDRTPLRIVGGQDINLSKKIELHVSP